MADIEMSNEAVYERMRLFHENRSALLNNLFGDVSLKVGDETFLADQLGQVSALVMKAVEIYCMGKMMWVYWEKRDPEAIDRIDMEEEKKAFMSFVADLWDDWHG